MPKNTRLFWKANAVHSDVELSDVSFYTDSQPISDGRMVVLLRTFGRTNDIIQLMTQLDQDLGNKYREIAQSLYFIILDSSDSEHLEETYRQCEWGNLSAFVFKSENLGGGGNISHLLYLMDKSFEKIDAYPDDILILDDDLNLTTEVLHRYFRQSYFRTKEVITSLPIFMKSKPNTIWEDGGYWGKLSEQTQGMSLNRQSIFPTLIRHGVTLTGYEHLDNFSTINYCEYSTFIFFGLSYNSFKKLGYPCAFFLRGDDIEYSLRAELNNIPLYTNPNLFAYHKGRNFFIILRKLI